MELLIFNNTKFCRFEFNACAISAHIAYSLGGGTIVFHHSQLPDEPGAIDMLIAYVVDYAREHHLKIIATCPDVRKYIRSHASEFVCVGKVFMAVA